MSIIGRRVLITGKHPHEGDVGRIKDAEMTSAGWALKIDLENCKHGTDGCYVYDPMHVRVIAESGKGKDNASRR